MKLNYSLLTVLLLLSCAVRALENDTFSDNGYEYVELDELNTSFPSEGEVEDSNSDSDFYDEDEIISESTDKASKNTAWNFEINNRSQDTLQVYLFPEKDIAATKSLTHLLPKDPEYFKNMSIFSPIFESTLKPGKSIRLANLKSDEDERLYYIVAVINKTNNTIKYYSVGLSDEEFTAYTAYIDGELRLLRPSNGRTSSGLSLLGNRGVLYKKSKESKQSKE